MVRLEATLVAAAGPALCSLLIWTWPDDLVVRLTRSFFMFLFAVFLVVNHWREQELDEAEEELKSKLEQLKDGSL